MIRFHLKCDNDHQFDSWFQSNAAFETLQKSNMLACTSCGSAKVSKMLMAPSVQITDATVAPLSQPATDTETQLAKLRAEIETNSDDVGLQFATEARAMHDGEIPERAIYGQANGKDALKLIQDGVPVLPLPFIPSKKKN